LGFWGELKRRKVIRVAITYAVVAWLIIQVASATFEGFGIPDWAFRFVVLMILLGFPIALIITWAFELTPDGVKLTRHVTPTERADSSQKKRNWLAFAFAGGLPTVIFGALAAFFFSTRVPELEAAAEDKSIAVLPFRNVSADADNQYFCDGVQEDILTTLANIGDMQVISRTSVMRYKDSDMSVPEIGAELDVSYILEGSVQRSGNRIRITGQLINAQTDEHLWAKSYDRELTDVFAIQAEISKEIAQSLRAVLTPEEVALIDKPMTVHPAAYDLVLKGRSIQRTTFYEDTSDRCEAIYRAATEMDPEYTDAWLELADTHVRLYFSRKDYTPERLEKARFAIDRASALSPGSSQVLIGQGNFHYYGHLDYKTARVYYEKALLHSPNNSDALAQLAYISRREKKWKETLHYLSEAHRLDPNNTNIANEYWEFSFNNRLYDLAIRLGKHMIEIGVQDPFVELKVLQAQCFKAGNFQFMEAYFEQFTAEEIHSDATLFMGRLITYMIEGNAEAYVRLWEHERPEGYNPEIWSEDIYYGLALDILGLSEEAAGLFRELLEDCEQSLLDSPENRDLLMNQVELYALLGDREKALGIMESLMKAVEKVDQLSYLMLRNRLTIYLAHLGELDAAVDLLEEVMQEPYSLEPLYLKSSLEYFPLRDHPRFIELVNDPKYREPSI